MNVKIKNPGEQIANIMRKDAELIHRCKGDFSKVLLILSDSNVKIQTILKALDGDVN